MKNKKINEKFPSGTIGYYIDKYPRITKALVIGILLYSSYNIRYERGYSNRIEYKRTECTEKMNLSEQKDSRLYPNEEWYNNLKCLQNLEDLFPSNQ